jgi:hypothetical protein
MKDLHTNGIENKCRPKWYQKQKFVKYSYPTGIKNCESFVIDA